ncbi:uncharacterized protein EI90DRAFT_2971147 [Cantharellus anzutake]|uniref:uncharacterized protein n=1 Tax=Cantharellus anzutake TaxID=1750568 RepID=UPI001904A3E7|nr:uncharacterized protein EI90DRAFT_2971147 [Cantharellus anzutake]KAF8333033.1 hypothetical protein EI90DRAFT_2971147 [Cantharellus anzutake]
MSSAASSATDIPTVCVLGASYGGHRAVQVLANSLPHGWRIVVIERNTHCNHLYVFPRIAVIPGHEHKAFIPYTNIFKTSPTLTTPQTPLADPSSHVLIHGHVTAVHPHSVRYISLDQGASLEERQVRFNYLIYALGSHLPAPINIWSEEPLKNIEEDGQPYVLNAASILQHGTKPEGLLWLRSAQERVKNSESVLVIGGGALGVQFATDIKGFYGEGKEVTLVHSGDRLLPRFDKWMHEQIIVQLERLGVKVLLSSRVDLSSKTERTLRTCDGRLISAELILLCTGQKPNTSLLSKIAPHSINPRTGLVTVLRSMQIGYFERPTPPPIHLSSPYPHIFVIGDAADAFGALNAGHTAWTQAEVASRNVISMIESETEDRELPELEHYIAPPPSIKISIGLDKAIYQSKGNVGFKGPEECPIDLNAGGMWKRRGLGTDDMTI